MTKNQKTAIRSHWSPMPLQFRREGVYGRKGQCWGFLMSASDAAKNANLLIARRAQA
jgi:hypothetical protein